MGRFTVCVLLLFNSFISVSTQCVERTSGDDEPELRVPWVPSVVSYLPFHVQTDGVAKITVEGNPTITAYIGFDNSVVTKEGCECENTPVSLDCTTEGGTITTLTALYGRRVSGSVLCTHSTPGATTNTGCDTTGAANLAIVQGMCDGFTSCTVTGNNGAFGDSCGGTYKYLRVTYQCSGVSSVADTLPGGDPAPGNDAVIILDDSSVAPSVSLGVVSLTDASYTQMYMEVDSNGFHIGFIGEEPFISIYNDIDVTEITSVVLEGAGAEVCSCEDPTCTPGGATPTVDWRICDNRFSSIAQGQSTSETSCVASHCGETAVDGNDNTVLGTSPFCFESDPATGANPWWRVDLGDEYHVFAIEIIKRADTLDASYLGCYIDTSTRALPNNMITSNTLTREVCIEHCRDNGQRYAGVQYFRQCFCGAATDNYAVYGSAPESQCNTDCDGDSSQKCGGPWRLNVFDLGDTMNADLEDHTIYVGNCMVTSDAGADFTSNTQCGIPVTSAEAGSTAEDAAEPIYRDCPSYTYGRYVYITDPVRLQFCEVNVYGVLPDDPTELNFVPCSPVVLESEESLSVDVVRSNGGNRPTCSYFDVDVEAACTSLTSTAIDPDDITATTIPLNSLKLSPGQSEFQVDFSVVDDGMEESVEYLGICLNAIDGAKEGDCSAIRIIITDTDPIHFLPEMAYEVLESTGSITIYVRRTGYLERASQVRVTTLVGVSAISDTDYQSFEETVHFPIGATEQMVTIIINDDTEAEIPDETFTVMLDTPSPGLVNPALNSVDVTILNDDPVIAFAYATYSVSEGGQFLTIQIIKTLSDREVTFHLESQPTGATPASVLLDYGLVVRDIVFPEDQTVLTIDDIPIYEDSEVEGSETFQLVLTTNDGTLGAIDTTTVTIGDNDALYSAVDRYIFVDETDESVTIRFVRAGHDLQERTFDVIVSGSEIANDLTIATEDVDFLRSGLNTITFLQGEDTTELIIPIVDDKLVEHNEVFYVDFNSAEGVGEVQSGRQRVSILIRSDDSSYSLQNVEYRVLESVGQFLVLVERGPGENIPGFLENEATVYLSTSTYEANDNDFQGLFNKPVNFAPGESVVACPIILDDDVIPESEERFFVILTNPNLAIDPDRNNATVWINDDDGVLSINTTERTVEESQGFITFTVSRKGLLNSKGVDQSLKRLTTAVVTAVGESASPGSDFQSYRTTVVLGTGEASVTDTIEIRNDDISEPTETFRIVLLEADGEIDEGNNEVTVSIIDDDTETFRFEHTEYNIGESCREIRVNIIRSGLAGAGTTLLVSTSDTEATYPQDFSPPQATVTFRGDQEVEFVTFDIVNDLIEEGSETLTLSLSKLSGSGTIDATGQTATIAIQDQIGSFSFESDRIDVTESVGTLRLPITRTGDFCGAAATIFVSTLDGEAKGVLDYVKFGGRIVTFTRGQVTSYVDIDIVDDDFHEIGEDFLVRITCGDANQVGIGEVWVTIHDNDAVYRFQNDRYEVLESDGTVSLIIEREGNVIEAGTASIETVPRRGSAIQNQDYLPTSTLVVEFAESQSQTSFSLTIIDDDLVEEDEEFFVRIWSVTNGRIEDSAEEATVVILDDDSGRRGSALSEEAIIGLAAGGGVLIVFLLSIILVCYCIAVRSRPRPIQPRPPSIYERSGPIVRPYDENDVFFGPRRPLVNRR